MDKPAKIHEDTLDSLLDRIAILREELVSVERSLERMKAAQQRAKKAAVIQQPVISLSCMVKGFQPTNHVRLSVRCQTKYASVLNRKDLTLIPHSLYK